MKPKDMIFSAFELQENPRVPSTVFGGGLWTIRQAGKQFSEVIKDPHAYAELIIKTNEKIRSPIVYVGSGYNNYLAAAIGGEIKERAVGAPDLVDPVIKEHADELDDYDVGTIEHDPIIQNIREAARIVMNEIGDDYVVAATAWGPFTLAAQMFDVEKFMKAMYKRKAEVRKTLKFATELIKQFYRPMLEENLISLISLADPTGSGDLISNRSFKVFSQPYLKTLIDWGNEYETYTWLHICGDTTDKLEAIVETGTHCFSLDYKVDMAEAKRRIGNIVCLAGNVDPVSALNEGDEEKVRQASEACINAASKGGGFILTSGCDLPPTITMENLQAMLSAG